MKHGRNIVCVLYQKKKVDLLNMTLLVGNMHNLSSSFFCVLQLIFNACAKWNSWVHANFVTSLPKVLL